MIIAKRVELQISELNKIKMFTSIVTIQLVKRKHPFTDIKGGYCILSKDGKCKVIRYNEEATVTHYNSSIFQILEYLELEATPELKKLVF